MCLVDLCSGRVTQRQEDLLSNGILIPVRVEGEKIACRSQCTNCSVLGLMESDCVETREEIIEIIGSRVFITYSYVFYTYLKSVSSSAIFWFRQISLMSMLK